MPLTVDGLKQAMITQLASVQYDARDDADEGTGPLTADRDKSLEALAKAIVNYITTNATVTGLCPPGTAGGPLTNGRVT